MTEPTEKENSEPKKSTLTQIKDDTKLMANKILSFFRAEKTAGDITEKSPTDTILKGIIKLLVEQIALRNVLTKMDKQKNIIEERIHERRHKEILKVLQSLPKQEKEGEKLEKLKKEAEDATETKAPVKKPTTKTSKTTPKKTAKKATTKKPTKIKKAPKKPTLANKVKDKPGAYSAAISSSGASVAVTGGLLAAASMSVRGETGVGDISKAGGDPKKVGQIVPNDPRPGVSSYGVFGINSGGSVQRFVSDNPQFGLVGKPGSKEFDDSWKKIATEKTKEFYDAQLNWYGKYVYGPTKRDMKSLLPENIGTSDKVVTYMTDRRNQMGKLYETEAITYAKSATTPEEFITKVAEHDSTDKFIRKAFPTYIKTHGDKNITGLKNRVELRKKMSLQVQQTGDTVNNDSVTNKELKKDMQDATPGSNKTVNNVGVSSTTPETKNKKSVDDRSPHERLKNG